MQRSAVKTVTAAAFAALLLRCAPEAEPPPPPPEHPASRLDAFAVNEGQANRVYFNDGSGSFTGEDAAAEASDSRDVALGDLDGR